MTHKLMGLTLVCISQVGAWALADTSKAGQETLEVGKPLTRASLLVPSTRVYLRYKISGEERATVDMWRRTVSFEEHQGQREMHIVWRWDSVGDPKFRRTADYWFEPGTFRPLTVERRLERNGETTVSAFQYLPNRVIGIADVPNNAAKDFMQALPAPMFNFETDMELLQTLPLKAGYEVRIPFYEAGPGRDAPAYYTYKVIGDGKIASPEGRETDCWIVMTDSTDPKNWGPTRFWLAKRTQVMIREEIRNTDGSIFVKMLIPPDTAASS
jgi:hypothetical protein